jgi:hypothetical protein
MQPRKIMSRRRANMLEAFEASTKMEGETGQEEDSNLFSGTGSPAAAHGPGKRLPGVVMLLGTLALGFLIGRLSAPAGTVTAGPASEEEPGTLPWLAEREGEEGAAGAPLTVVPAPEIAEPSPSSAEGETTTMALGTASPGNAGLMDPANRVTLRVIYYAEDEEDRAWETHDYLVDQGLPVGSPVRTGRIIVLLVGAASGAGELEGLKGRLRTLPGPHNESGAFKGAYVVNIDSYIER